MDRRLNKCYSFHSILRVHFEQEQKKNSKKVEIFIIGTIPHHLQRVDMCTGATKIQTMHFFTTFMNHHIGKKSNTLTQSTDLNKSN